MLASLASSLFISFSDKKFAKKMKKDSYFFEINGTRISLRSILVNFFASHSSFFSKKTELRFASSGSSLPQHKIPLFTCRRWLLQQRKILLFTWPFQQRKILLYFRSWICPKVDQKIANMTKKILKTLRPFGPPSRRFR